MHKLNIHHNELQMCRGLWMKVTFWLSVWNEEEIRASKLILTFLDCWLILLLQSAIKTDQNKKYGEKN